MDLNNSFRVGVPVDKAWAVLTDLERIAPCMPGAQLEEVEGDEFRGVVKVKVGPITAQYKGKATIVEQDRAAGRMVIRAEGRDTRGQGNASATITASLTPDGHGTQVVVDTALDVTGKVAQFGRGVLADVSSKLLSQFVDCLEKDLLSGDLGDGSDGDSGAAPLQDSAGAPTLSPSVSDPELATAVGETGVEGVSGVSGGKAHSVLRKIESEPVAPVNLLDAAGGSVAKRAVPAIVAGVLAVLLVRRILR